jgi:hypothetical protein
MGKIVVGQKNPKDYDGGLLTVAAPMMQPTDDVVMASQQTGDGQVMTDEMKRENRLKEILAMDESEQLPLLLAEGYEEEAKKLSEKLADFDGKAVEQGDGEPAADAAGVVADEGEATATTEKKPKTAKKTPKTKK